MNWLDTAHDALHELREARKSLDAMDAYIRRILFQPFLRRTLLGFKDEIKGNVEGATTKVRALRTELQAAIARVTALENMPGAWTDADVAEIKASMVALDASFTAALPDGGATDPNDPASGNFAARNR